MVGSSADAVLAVLREGRLRDIRTHLQALSPEEAHAATERVCVLLRHALAGKTLGPEHRWLIMALQYVGSSDAGELATQALAQAVRLKNCCGCTLNRTVRVVGATKPVEAIPILVDVVCRTEHPRHKHLAAVCLRQIVKARGAKARVLLSRGRAKLRRELRHMETQLGVTPTVTPPRGWVHVPGSPSWRAALARAIRATEALLALA